MKPYLFIGIIIAVILAILGWIYWNELNPQEQ